ncbi:YfgM family protein [Frateuria hangzhouensis]|uniref:YfgM family protein n=1 Tax=Frateuria hangzhouensis TaxID=2995589 RepID=UPI002260D7D6|nr:tetratricopeptide repeat protein [Frateuria sp. STR12]MCX7512177.1 tetratricopeptide repeat protein [Frateuria sp. STR12]
MAFDAYDDYEQGERVQQWLRQNGLSILIGIVIGLVAIFGWQQWRNHQATRQMEAANIYQQLQSALAAGKGSQADQLVDRLQKDYAKSTYAVLAASDLAKRQVEAKQLDKALASLQWARNHVGDNVLKPLIELRVAKVQLAAGKGNDALTTLDTVTAKGYEALRQELRGDTLVKLGRADDARKAYQAALAAMDEDAPQRAALQLKLDDLAVAGKQGA